MGLAVVLGALHLHSRLRDPEQGNSRQETQREEAEAEVETGDATDDDDEVSLQSPTDQVAPDRPHGLHRLSSATHKTPFSTPLHTSPTTITDTPRSWISRLKSLILPDVENPDSLEKFIPNYRWTPIISGVVIPFSILLEIPGLTEHWYIRTEAYQIVETRPNSMVLEVGLAFSMVCGLLANVCLVARFLEKRVKTVTVMCIVFLTIHDVINITAVTVFGVEHRFDDGFTYGQSFWMTVCSTAASTVTNISLLVDLIRTPEFARSGSGLTRKQSALMIIVIVLLVYIAFGALINSILGHLNFIDGLYFTVVTIETIGFGDIKPSSTGSRVFICFYMVFGILNLGVAVAMTRETVLEGLELSYRRRLRELRMRRRESRRFRRWEVRWRRAVEWRLKEAGEPVWVSDERYPWEKVKFVGLSGPRDGAGETHWARKWLEGVGLMKPSDQRKERSSGYVRNHPRGKHLNIDALDEQQLEAAALEAGVPLRMFLTSPRPSSRRMPSSPHSRRRRSSDASHSTNHSTQSLGLVNTLIRPPQQLNQPGTATATASGWPRYPQTPTHAQVGRMAAMVTKFGLAVGGAGVWHGEEEGNEAGKREGEEKGENDSEKREEVEIEHGQGPSSPSEPNTHLDQSIKTPRSPNPAQASASTSTQPQDALGTADMSALHPELRKWRKDIVRSAAEKNAVSYERFKEEMEVEETKAYYAKLSVAWSLFLLFWLVGSAIFSKTEGWSFGIALYFCVCAFTTTGYGDFSPQTPAGRSVFVVWALLGVATVTILIAVLEEAGSSKYKSVLHSKTFDSAVKKYRKQESEESKRTSDALAQRALQPTNNNAEGDGESSPAKIDDAIAAAQKQLEALPGEIIKRARTFHEHIQYFVVNTSGSASDAVALEGDGGGSRGECEAEREGMREKGREGKDKSTGKEIMGRIPGELKDLLDRIAEVEDIGERAKREILEDADSRNTLIMLSIERALRQMINASEQALTMLAERDRLRAQKDRQGQEQREDHSSSGSPSSPTSTSDCNQDIYKAREGEKSVLPEQAISEHQRL